LAEPSTATPGNGYLEALVGPKTTAYTEQIRRITKTGFIDPDGVEHQVDVIICATGFDTTYNLKFPVYVNGLDMNEKWQSRDKVPSYLSLGYAQVCFGWTLVPVVLTLQTGSKLFRQWWSILPERPRLILPNRPGIHRL
jgi:cation diffusion facilitator CzcD-associated flavoprotein CzcO